jgi:glycosyltransferase involved in cell wall biosynthesis
MKVLLLSRYGSLGASSRVRMYQFLPDLDAAGISVTPAPLVDDRLLTGRYASGGYPAGALVTRYLERVRWLLRSGRYDLLWIEYELFPWLPAIGESLLARLGVPFVVEYDDAVFHRYDADARRLVRAVLGRKIDHTMRRARAVIVGNAYLAERARAAGAAHVVELPSVVDTDVYVPGGTDGAGPPVVGWIGSPTTAPYLHMVEDVLAALVREERVRVTLVGVEPGRTRWAFACAERAWQPAHEVADLQSFDIGIMPLPDSPWERGKCGYKLVQYLGCGKPVVASPVGANRDIVRVGVDGYLAETADEWRAALLELAGDPARRARMGLAGRARVEHGYARRAIVPRLIETLSAAARTCSTI